MPNFTVTGEVDPFLHVHLLPNFVSSIMFMVVMNIRSAIIAESTLSFLGIGLPMEIISTAILPNGLIPPIENSNKSFSGNASITLLVKFLCPCQCFKSCSLERTCAVAAMFFCFKINFYTKITRQLWQQFVSSKNKFYFSFLGVPACRFGARFARAPTACGRSSSTIFCLHFVSAKGFPAPPSHGILWL